MESGEELKPSWGLTRASHFLQNFEPPTTFRLGMGREPQSINGPSDPAQHGVERSPADRGESDLGCLDLSHPDTLDSTNLFGHGG
jgi:hypothetical protein